jgi:hypothetical protein
MAECTDKNMIDKDEYPQTARPTGGRTHRLPPLTRSVSLHREGPG